MMMSNGIFDTHARIIEDLIVNAISDGKIEEVPREEEKYKEFGDCFFRIATVDITRSCEEPGLVTQEQYPAIAISFSVRKSRSGKSFYKITLLREIDEIQTSNVIVFNVWDKDRKTNFHSDQFVAILLKKYNITMSLVSLGAIRKSLDDLGIGTGCNKPVRKI